MMCPNRPLSDQMRINIVIPRYMFVFVVTKLECHLNTKYTLSCDLGLLTRKKSELLLLFADSVDSEIDDITILNNVCLVINDSKIIASWV